MSEPASPRSSVASADGDAPYPHEPRLAAWVAAGLLEPEAARRIEAFEAERAARSRKTPAFALALLGALALVVGLGTLVASNWEDITDTWKLTALGALLLASSAFAWSKRDLPPTDAHVALDVGLLLHTGFTLAGLALVSQIFEQDGELWELLAIWSILTTPLLSWARTRFAHVVWYLGLEVTLLTSAEDLARFLGAEVVGRDAEDLLAAFVIGTAGAALAGLFARSENAERSAVGRLFFQLHLAVLGLFGGLTWFDDSIGAPLFVLFGFSSVLLLAALFWNRPRRFGFSSEGPPFALLAVGYAGSLARPAFGWDESGFGAFVSFVSFFGLLWFFAHRAGRTAWVRASIFFLAARIVFASFELFESMLVTGLVLAGLGSALLAFTRNGFRNPGAAPSPRGES